jgi:hypothetical protein
MSLRIRTFKKVLAISLLITTSCSPGMFFGGHDERILKTPSYRRVNTACGGIDLSTSTLSVSQSREILHCFNANGALDPLDRLVSRMTDAELSPLVRGLNANFLNNEKKIYELETTFRALEEQKLLGPALMSFGRLIENESWVRSALSLLQGSFEGEYQEDVLKALEILSERITPEGVSFALDFLNSLLKEEAVSDLVFQLTKPLSAPRQEASFDELIQGLHQYISREHVYLCDEQKVPIKRDWIQAVLEPGPGDLGSVLEEVIGTDESSIQKNIQSLSDIFKVSFSPQQEDGGSEPYLLEELSSAMRDLRRPVHCMKGTQSIPNAALHVLRELALHQRSSSSVSAAEYVLRALPLELMSLGPFCEYPQEIQAYYPVLARLAKTGAMDPLARVIGALYSVERPWKGCLGEIPLSGERHRPLLSGSFVFV